jgi:hypothetical protein
MCSGPERAGRHVSMRCSPRKTPAGQWKVPDCSTGRSTNWTAALRRASSCGWMIGLILPRRPPVHRRWLWPVPRRSRLVGSPTRQPGRCLFMGRLWNLPQRQAPASRRFTVEPMRQLRHPPPVRLLFPLTKPGRDHFNPLRRQEPHHPIRSPLHRQRPGAGAAGEGGAGKVAGSSRPPGSMAPGNKGREGKRPNQGRFE